MSDFKTLERLIDNGTTHITIATPSGWKCKRAGCRTNYLHKHGTYATLDQQFIFLRDNVGAGKDVPPTRLSEKEARLYIGTCLKDVDRAINKIKRGGIVHTRYATYTAKSI